MTLLSCDLTLAKRGRLGKRRLRWERRRIRQWRLGRRRGRLWWQRGRLGERRYRRRRTVLTHEGHAPLGTSISHFRGSVRHASTPEGASTRQHGPQVIPRATPKVSLSASESRTYGRPQAEMIGAGPYASTRRGSVISHTCGRLTTVTTLWSRTTHDSPRRRTAALGRFNRVGDRATRYLPIVDRLVPT
jgi:hypothetical protein